MQLKQNSSKDIIILALNNSINMNNKFLKIMFGCIEIIANLRLNNYIISFKGQYSINHNLFFSQSSKHLFYNQVLFCNSQILFYTQLPITFIIYYIIFCSPMKKVQKVIHQQLIIQLTTSYPFNSGIYPDCHCLVRYNKTFPEEQYQSIKNHLERNCNLKHKHLINIMKTIVSKKSSNLDVYYEYISQSLEAIIHTLKYQQIQKLKFQLYDVCRFIISSNINPEIYLSNIGWKDGNLKFFLPLESNLINPVMKKRELIIAKQYEINQFISEILSKFQFNLKKSVNLKNNQYRSQFPFKQILNSQHNIIKNIASVQKEPRISSLTNKASANSFKIHQSSAFQKIKTIDDKINQLLAKMRKPSIKLTEIRKQSKQRSAQKTINQKSIPVYMHKQNQPKKTPKANRQDQKNLYKQHKFYTPIKSFDQQSIDTYNLQLGEVLQMPKITNPQMRQTTKQSPKLVFNDKLHQSVGNKGNQDFVKTIRNHKKAYSQLNLWKKKSMKSSNMIKQISKQSSNDQRSKQKKSQHKSMTVKSHPKTNSQKKINQNQFNFQKKINIQTDKYIPKQTRINHDFQKSKKDGKAQLNNLNNSAQFIKKKIQTHLKSKPNKHQLKLKQILKNQHLHKSEMPIKSNTSSQKNIKTQSKQIQKKKVINCEIPGFQQMMKNYDFQEQITNDFNTIFQYQTTPTATLRSKLSNPVKSVSNQKKTIIQEANLTQSFREKRNIKINQRVQQALIKSKATLQFYQKLGSNQKKA